MWDWEWITSGGTALVMVAISGIGIYIALLIFVRFNGLRSFSKMSSFDFAITVAFGSVMASTLLAEKPSLADGAMGLAVLFSLQYIVSKARRTTQFEHLVDNEPLLLMAGPHVLEDNLDLARLTSHDLRSHLRLAGVTHPNQVLAVVFETSSDVSVLKISDQVDPWLFESVRDADKLPFVTAQK